MAILEVLSTNVKGAEKANFGIQQWNWDFLFNGCLQSDIL